MANPIPGGAPNINQWTPGTTYPPGSVVRPTSSVGSGTTAITNAGFESGTLTGWTSAGSWAITTVDAYDGTHSAKLPAGSGTKELWNNVVVVVVPGQTINLQCYFNQGANIPSNVLLEMGLMWYDSTNAGAGGGFSATGYLSTTVGDLAPSNVVGAFWHKYLCQGTAPANAAYCQITSRCTNVGGNDVLVDAFSWNYLIPNAPSQKLFYAVQVGTGKSGQIEPDWTLTPPITDNTVTWSNTPPTSILWRAGALAISANVEPVWPTQPGQMIHDGNMDWVAVTPQVVDPNDTTLPPQSKYVFTASSKIFVLDGDIARYCATTNPLDWTSEGDAGFLPIGLQAFGTNPFVAAGLYRSNGVFFNSQGLQMWQLDEDPANMALLDAIPVGCTQYRSLASINNDLFFLAGQGVRTMGISAGSGNLQAGDVGMPIDPLVQAAMTWANANSVVPIGGYFPSLGQYFLAFPNWPADGLFWSSGGSGTASGTNTYVVTIPGTTSYHVGPFFFITFTNGSTGASTLNISGFGALTIEDHTKITAGSSWFVYYNSTLNRFDISGGITRVFVYSMSRIGEVGAWSHYLFQYVLEDFCQAGDDLYMRGTINNVPQMFKFDPSSNIDSNVGSTLFTYSIVQWPWLDDGQPGQTKQLTGFDAAVTLDNPSFQNYTIEVGYDQTNPAAFTAPYTLTGDTVPGMMYPIQVKAPSFSIRFAFESSNKWSIQMANLYLTDKRLES